MNRILLLLFLCIATIVSAEELQVNVTGIGANADEARAQALDQANKLGVSYIVAREQHLSPPAVKVHHCTLALICFVAESRENPGFLYPVIGIGSSKEEARMQCTNTADALFPNKYQIREEKYVGSGVIWQCNMILFVDIMPGNQRRSAVVLGETEFTVYGIGNTQLLARREALSMARRLFGDEFDIVEEDFSGFGTFWRCKMLVRVFIPGERTQSQLIQEIQTVAQTQERAKALAVEKLQQITTMSQRRVEETSTSCSPMYNQAGEKLWICHIRWRFVD